MLWILLSRVSKFVISFEYFNRILTRDALLLVSPLVSSTGVEGVINVASDSSFGDDLKIVESVVSLNKEVLASVKAAGTVKSFVITSSRVASFHPDATSSYEIDDSNWFDEAYGLAEKSQDSLKPFLVYAASKVAGEKAVWSFVEKEKVSRVQEEENPSIPLASLTFDLFFFFFGLLASAA